MLVAAQNKTIDILEYALQIIEQYDREFQKRVQNKEEGKKGGKKVKHNQIVLSRFDDVKENYKELFYFQQQRAIDFIRNSKAYKLADERMHLNEKFERSYEFTNQMYNSINSQIVLPLQDKIFLVYDASLKKASFVFESIQNMHLTEKLGEKYDDAKVTLSKNWMRLDLNNDGKVTMSDLIEAVKNLRTIIRENDLTNRAIEFKSSLYRKAIGFIDREQPAHDTPREEVPLAKVEGSENSSDSIEMQQLADKDD